jgi:hypothetical protein
MANLPNRYADLSTLGTFTTMVDERTPGIKFDEGKPRFDLIPPEFLLELAKLYTVGAEKYTPRNWEKGMAWSRPLAALYRHLNKWQMGESVDPETGINHLVSAIWNAIALYTYETRHIGEDDTVRPPCQGGN